MTWRPSIALQPEQGLFSRFITGRPVLSLFVCLVLSLSACHHESPATKATLPLSAMADFLRAKSAWLRREPRQALSWSLRVLAADPSSQRARIVAASSLAVLEELARARALLRQGSSQSSRLLIERARLAFLAGDRVQALSLMRRIEKKAKTASAWTALSRLWRLLSDSQAEIECLNRALALKMDHLEALLRLAWWLRRKGRPGQADEILVRAGRVHPEAYQVPIQRVAAHLDMGRAQDAWRILVAAREGLPADLELAGESFRLALFMGRRDLADSVLASLSGYRGAIYRAFVAGRALALGDYARAARLAKQALAEHWSLNAFRIRLASLLASGAADRAVEDLKAFFAGRRFDETLTGLAEPFIRWGSCRPALTIFRSGITWAVKNPTCRSGAWALLELAQLEAACGDRSKALSMEAVVGHRCGLASGIAFARSTILADAGRPRAAARLALRLSSRDPDDPQAANQAGYLLADAGIDLKRADRLLRDAVLAEPLSGAIRDSLGWLEYRKGRLHRALRILTLARRLLPAEPEVAWHLGAVFQALADHCPDLVCRRRAAHRARSWYEQALKTGLAPRFRQRVSRNMARLDRIPQTHPRSDRNKEDP